MLILTNRDCILHFDVDTISAKDISSVFVSHRTGGHLHDKYFVKMWADTFFFLCNSPCCIIFNIADTGWVFWVFLFEDKKRQSFSGTTQWKKQPRQSAQCADFPVNLCLSGHELVFNAVDRGSLTPTDGLLVPLSLTTCLQREISLTSFLKISCLKCVVSFRVTHHLPWITILRRVSEPCRMETLLPFCEYITFSKT